MLLRAYREAFAGLSTETWLLTAVQLINRCGTMVLPFLAVYLSQERGYSPAEAGRMLAVYGVGAIVGTYTGGRLTQRFGPIRVLIGAELAAAPGFLTIPFCTTTGSLAAALFCLSIVNEAVRPAISTAVSLFSANESLPRAYALNRLALNLGMTVGPTIGGFLAVADYHLLFVVNAAFAMITAAVTAYFFFGKRPKATAEAVDDNADATPPHRDRVYLAYLALQFFGAVIFFQSMTTMPLYWKQQCAFVEWQIGLLFAVNTLAIVMLEMPLIKSVERLPALRLIAIGTLLICLGFAMTALAKGFLVAVVAVLIWTFGEMLSAPFTATFAVGRSGLEQNRGAYLGLLSSCFSAAFVVAPIAGTALYERHADLPWAACLAMGALLPIGFLLLDRRTSNAGGYAS